MVKERNQTLRRKTFERDNFTCRKCGLKDREMIKIEAHHITPLYRNGKNELGNMITLCSDCHHFAPDKKEEFDKYLKEECDGTLTVLLKAFKKVRETNSELFNELDKS